MPNFALGVATGYAMANTFKQECLADTCNCEVKNDPYCQAYCTHETIKEEYFRVHHPVLNAMEIFGGGALIVILMLAGLLVIRGLFLYWRSRS